MAIFNDLPSLAKIRNELGPEKMLIFVIDIILNVSEYFNVGKTISVNQAKQTAEFIIEDFGYMKPSELKYCFGNGKKGVYGKIYDRIDGAVLFDWLNEYQDERLNACIDKNEREASDWKRQEHIENAMIALLPVFKSVKVEEKKTEQKQTHVEIDVFKGFVDEFGKLALRSEIEGGKGRFVDYKGKILNVDEYCKARYKEL